MGSSSTSRTAITLIADGTTTRIGANLQIAAMPWTTVGKGGTSLRKRGSRRFHPPLGFTFYDDIAAFVPALPKRLYVIGPGIIDSAGDEAVFEEAAEKLEGVDHLVRIPKDLVAENIDEPTAIRNGIHELTNPWDFFDGIALLPGWESSDGVKLMVKVAKACNMTCKTVEEWLKGGENVAA